MLDGRDSAHMQPNRSPVNTVFNQYALTPPLTVAGNDGCEPGAQGRKKVEIVETVARMLARALAPQRRILLLGDLLPVLDMALRKEVQFGLKLLSQVTRLGFISVTHDHEGALSMSDRSVVMAGGRISKVVYARKVYDGPVSRFVAGFIGEMNFWSATCAAGQLHLPPAAAALSVDHPDGPVSLMVQSEHVMPVALQPRALELTAQVFRLVYFDTNAHVHLRLANDSPLIAWVLNDLRGGRTCRERDSIPLCLPGEALRLLSQEAA